MPRTTTDYSKLVIYKIQHINNPELLYVGSTTVILQNGNITHKNWL